VAVHVVRAAHSDRWSRAEGDRLAAAGGDGPGRKAGASAGPGGAPGRLTAHNLPDAGHWLHVDNFEGLLGMLVPGVAAAAGVVRDRAQAAAHGGRG